MSDDGRALPEFAAGLSQTGSDRCSFEQIVDYALARVGTSHGDVILRSRRHGLETVAPSDALVAQADRWQRELHEGPCADPSREAVALVSNDLAHDARWPRWGPEVAAAGLHSLLSVQLFSGSRVIGAVNLYGGPGREFGRGDVATARAFAPHLSLAVAAIDEVRHLRRALETRTVIGQAQGILMERYGLSADQAFAVLTRYSQDGNRRLRGVARSLVEQSASTRPVATEL